MNKADNENLKSFHKDLKEVKNFNEQKGLKEIKLKDLNQCEHYKDVGCIKDVCTCYTLVKADNLPLSAEEYFDLNIGKYDKYSEIMEAYASYLLSHHINALTERKYSEEEVDFLIKLLRTTTEYEVLESFRNKVEQFKK